MKLESSCIIEAAREEVWIFLLDVVESAPCIDGVEGIHSIGSDRYEGLLRIRVGPVRLEFQGEVTVEEVDASAHRAVLRARAADQRRGGRLEARISFELLELAEQRTELRSCLDLNLAGRIAELAQPLIRKKSQQLLDRFATRVNERLAPVSDHEPRGESQ